MADDAIILGSETPDADVLVYDKGLAYFEGNITIDPSGTEVQLEINPDGNNHNATYEFVNEV